MSERAHADSSLSRARETSLFFFFFFLVSKKSPHPLPSSPTYPLWNSVKSAGKVFFLARSPDAPRTATVSVRSQGTPGRTSSRVEAETRRSRSGDEVEEASAAEGGRGGRGEAIVAAAPSLEASAKALVAVELIIVFFVSGYRCALEGERALERGCWREAQRGRTRARKERRVEDKSEGRNNRWPREERATTEKMEQIFFSHSLDFFQRRRQLS